MWVCNCAAYRKVVAGMHSLDRGGIALGNLAVALNEAGVERWQEFALCNGIHFLLVLLTGRYKRLIR